MSDERPPKTETNWIATCTEAWGVGYTKHDALQTMLSYIDVPATVEEVLLVEHVGSVDVRGMYVDCNGTFVQEEKIAFDHPDDGEGLAELAHHADQAQRLSERLYDDVTITDEYDAFDE